MNKCLSCLNINLTICNGHNNMLILRSSVTYIPIIFFWGVQGRLFLSARIVGFYANLFGNKTKFFFLWEDIEDIQILSPSLATVGSPSLVIILWKGRGLDARHGAKSQDEEGRLRFYFQSFVSFNDASRY